MQTALRFVVAFLITSSFIGLEAYGAKPPRPRMPTNSSNLHREDEDDNGKFDPAFQEFVQEQAALRNPLPGMVYFNSEIVTDQEIDDAGNTESLPVLFRETEKQRLYNIMLRRNGPFPIVRGENGVGKSVLINEIARDIVTGRIPRGALYQQIFEDTVILRVPVRTFIPGGMDIKAYIDTVRFISESLNRKIIIAMNESHFLNDYMVSVLRQEAEKKNPIRIILETDNKSYGNSIAGHPSFTSLVEEIMVPAFKPEQTKAVLRELVTRQFDRFRITVSNEIIDAVVDVAPDYRRDVAEPRRSLKLLEDFAIDLYGRNNGSATVASKQDLYRFVAARAKLPVLPQDEEAFTTYMTELKRRLKEKVIGQDVMVDGLVDQFGAALKSRSRQHSVALMLGPTGVGKSYLPEMLAEMFYGDKDRYLELDMTKYAEKTSHTTLFGANNGYISSDKEKGLLCDFFDGRGKGGGIVVMNEIEEMNTDSLTAFMEIFDKGQFPGGDGRIRFVGKTLFVLTSNKNSDRILSYDAIKGMTRAELDRRLRGIKEETLKKAFTEKRSYGENEKVAVKPAVLERVDRLYFASPMLSEEAVRIAELEIGRFVRDYQTQGLTRLNVDRSVAEVITKAYYNETLGSRQIRTSVQRYMSKAVEDFKARFGFNVNQINISGSMHPALKTVSYLRLSDDQGHDLTIDGPRLPVDNLLMDPEFRERLANLEENVKKEIFGQEEAIKTIVAALKGKYVENAKNQTTAGFLLGVTGSGKSQLAKVIAKHLYGNERALGLFDMGQVMDAHAMSTIFSPPKGILGSTEPGEVEQFLINFPDGGVMLFDEMSNIGGNDPARKNALAKQFYTMMHEGYYKSPSGKIYPLHNHLIIFTGNDGEEYFKGLMSDSLLDETYKELMKKPSFVESLLTKAGFTPAFVGRLKFAVMMRPTLSDIKILIAKKFLNEWRDTIQKNQPFDIVFENEEELAKQVALLMFSPKTGARSVEKWVKTVAGQLVGDEALKLNWDRLLNNGERARFVISSNVIAPTRPFYEGEEPDKTEAIVKVRAYMGDQVVAESQIDFTNKAFFQPQAHIRQAKAVAHHEMGHAVNAHTDATGKKLVKITIIPESIGEGDEAINAAGYAQYRRVTTKDLPGWEFLIKNIAGMLAGSEAEADFVGEDKRSSGRSNDVDQATDLAARMLIDSHLLPELDRIRVYKKAGGDLKDLPKDLKDLLDAKVHEVLAAGRELARTTNKKYHNVINNGVEFLLRYGTIHAEEYERLVEAVEAAERAAGPDKNVTIDLEAIRIKVPCDDLLAGDAGKDKAPIKNPGSKSGNDVATLIKKLLRGEW